MVGIRKGAVPSSLRRTNERNIIGLLLRMGAASRADLAKAAGMSQPTAGKITSALINLGILQEVDEGEPARARREVTPLRVGRPGRLLRLNADRPRFLAIELGVERTNLAALPISFGCEDRWTSSLATPSSPEQWQSLLRKTVAQFDRHHLWGALVSVPGIVDESAGRVLFSPNLHWTASRDLPALVTEIWPVPVLLVQEIRALALGHLATEPECENFLLVDFGAGVGGAIVESGRLLSSPLPLNGEFGHTPVPGNDRSCGCGARGCVETLVSDTGLLESFAASGHPPPHDWPALATLLEQRGIPEWLRKSLDAAAATIAGGLNVLGLNDVVITGTLAELPPLVVEYLAAAINRGAMWARFGEIHIRTAPRHRAAGLVVVGIDRLLVPATPASLKKLHPREPQRTTGS
jgi:predicted NBD/HSP70 family sugar kinase